MYIYFFATITIVTRTPLNLHVHCISCFYVSNTTEQALLENLIVAQHVKKIYYSVDNRPIAVHNPYQSRDVHFVTLKCVLRYSLMLCCLFLRLHQTFFFTGATTHCGFVFCSPLAGL